MPKSTSRLAPARLSGSINWATSSKQKSRLATEFIIPGATITGAALDLARTIVRRAERQIVRLYHEGDITNANVLRYLNRLSDVIFILARHEEAAAAKRLTEVAPQARTES